MAAPDGAEQLEALLKEHKRYFTTLPDGRIQCNCNGHQFPARYDVIAAFVKGKKFATLKKRYDAEQNLSQYEPFIIHSANFPLMLYCTLTGQLIEQSLEAVKTHMKGKKFKRNKELFVADKRELRPEPDIDTLMAQIMGRQASTKRDGSDSDISDSDAEGNPSGSRDALSDGEEGEGVATSDSEDAMSDGEEGEPGGSDSDVSMSGDEATAAQAVKAAGKTTKAEGGSTRQPAAKPAAGKAAGKKQQKAAATTAPAQANGHTGSKQAKGGKGKGGGDKGDNKAKAKASGGNLGADDDGPDFWVPEEFADIEPVAAGSPDSPTANGHTNGHSNGHANGHGKPGKADKGAGKGKGQSKGQGKGNQASTGDAEGVEGVQQSSKDSRGTKRKLAGGPAPAAAGAKQQAAAAAQAKQARQQAQEHLARGAAKPPAKVAAKKAAADAALKADVAAVLAGAMAGGVTGEGAGSDFEFELDGGEANGKAGAAKPADKPGAGKSKKNVNRPSKAKKAKV